MNMMNKFAKFKFECREPFQTVIPTNENELSEMNKLVYNNCGQKNPLRHVACVLTWLAPASGCVCVLKWLAPTGSLCGPTRLTPAGGCMHAYQVGTCWRYVRVSVL